MATPQNSLACRGHVLHITSSIFANGLVTGVDPYPSKQTSNRSWFLWKGKILGSCCVRWKRGKLLRKITTKYPLTKAQTHLLMLLLLCWYLSRSVPEVRWNELRSKVILEIIVWKYLEVLRQKTTQFPRNSGYYLPHIVSQIITCCYTE